MNKHCLMYAFCLIAIFMTLPSETQEQDNSPGQGMSASQAKFMRRKLEFTKEIVAGLATEDFGKITQGAQDMMLLSHESNWNSVGSPSYLKSSSDFRETVQRLREAGREKNLDAATLAYFEVTMNCVRCHRKLRQGLMSSKDVEN